MIRTKDAVVFAVLIGVCPAPGQVPVPPNLTSLTAVTSPLTSGKYSSPGYLTGNVCFPLGFGYKCGITTTVTITAGAALNASVTGFGLTFGVTASVSISQS